MAADGGNPPLSTTTTVALTVTDINDNPPIFNNSNYSFAVAENDPAGSYVGTLLVSDSDDQAAANISFRLEGPHSER